MSKLYNRIISMKATNPEIISYLRKKGLKALTRYRKEELMLLFDFVNMTVPKLKVKGREIGFTKNQLNIKKTSLVMKIFEFENKVREDYASVRVVGKEIIKQPSIITNLNSYDDVTDNKRALYYSLNFYDQLKRLHRILFSRCGPAITKGDLQVLTIAEPPVNDKSGQEGILRYSENVPLTRNTKVDNIKFNLQNPDSNVKFHFVGWKIALTLKNDKKLSRGCIDDLKAFHPSSNRKYHELTTASTSTGKLCIYETHRHIRDIKNLKYVRRNNKKYSDEVNKALKDEGEKIESLIREGRLIESLTELCKKDNKEHLIVFYGSHITMDEKTKTFQIDGDKPILVNKNGAKEIWSKQLFNWIDKEVFLYDKNIHVAPYTFRIEKKKKIDSIKEKIQEQFILRKQIIKNNVIKYDGILGYDTETYLDENHNSILYCICLYGELKNKKIEKKFYGKECLKEFIQYLDSIKSEINKVKSRSKTSKPPIYIFGFNNSRFDNILIYDEFLTLDPRTKMCIASSSIKYIKYNNLCIYDISLHYSGGNLRQTCKQFNLEEEKGVFPYKFVTKDNLDYVGSVPDLKYWNTEEERNEYLQNEGNIFKMKEYTEKYCLLDSKLVYDMAKLHYNSCSGEINGRKYNVFKSPTSANLSLKMFKQCFLKDPLVQSPDEVIEKEKQAYKGGRTEVFKKYFENKDIKLDGNNNKNLDNYLYYVDINSSYPSGMTELMPYKYIRTNKYINVVECEDKKDLDIFTDYYLYKAKIEYKGKNKNFIPNILVREKGNIIGVKDSDYNYHWGKELKEAVLNDCKVTYNEMIQYEGKKVFKEFAEYFYNERLSIKKKNAVLSLFYKTVMNSLYGKFGQRTFTKSAIINGTSELKKYIKNDSTILVSWKEIGDRLLIEYREEGDEYESIGKLMRFSSYIACTSRCKLSEIMRDVGHENVYYCDTDSIFTSKKPNNKFLDQNILGKWKYECKPIVEAYFLAPKVYYYKTIDDYEGKACKGMNKYNFDKDTYKDLYTKKRSSVDQTKDMFFRSLEGVKIKPQTRNLKPIYNKRIWLNNESYPFDNISEWKKK